MATDFVRSDISVREIDARGPWRYLWSLTLRHRWLGLITAVCGILWLVPAALLPLAIGAAIDVVGDRKAGFDALLWWAAAVVGLGIVQAVFGGVLFKFAGQLWISAVEDTESAVTTHVTHLGASVRQQISPGDVVAVPANDIDGIGGTLEITGRLVGSVLSFVLVVTVLTANTPVLGLVVLIGVPLATVGLGPLIGPLRRRGDVHRERLGETTKLAADIVSGLRVLRGIGGERRFLSKFVASSQSVRRAGVATGRVNALLWAIEIALPGMVTVLVVWLGARMALTNTITVGELVAFYGASAYLVIPISTCTEALHTISEGLVSARRVCRILRLRPLLTTSARHLPVGPLSLTDETTGIRIEAGRLTVIARPELFAELPDRLARYVDPAPGAAVLAAGDSTASDSAASDSTTVQLADVDLAEVRRRIVLAHNQDMLFSGALRAELTGQIDGEPGLTGGVSLADALVAADATDVVESLPAGLDEVLVERGRSLSGGQRQRLMLVRALLTDAEVLILDQPTSAVDAHTEARIAERVAALRTGRTTVVLTESPLWIARADTAIERVINKHGAS